MITHPNLNHGSPLALSVERVRNIVNQNEPDTTTIPARPFLKWVGGKRSILPELLLRMPKYYERYIEPFLGGGTLFFAKQPQKAYLSDINFHLIITFIVVRDHPEKLIELLRIHEANHSHEYFYQIRIKLLETTDPAIIASYFIYLNKTCFNGLYRVNKSGKFNVPIGDYKNPSILDEINLRNTSKALQNADIRQHNFMNVKPGKDDFFYIDPPYHATYSQYNDAGFTDENHKKLAIFCRTIDAKNGYFMVSNSDTSFVRELYKGYNIEEVSASRNISCKGDQRGKQVELIIRNYAN